MKILHVCSIFHDVSNGPSFSVPAMITVLNERGLSSELLNLQHSRADKTLVDKYTFNYFDYMQFDFSDLDKYGLVVFHQFWEKKFIPLFIHCLLKKIPYIIVPRGSLATNALKRKWYKKLFFSPLYILFLLKSYKIHFLTEQEKEVSIFFNKKSFVVPNGISLPNSAVTVNQNYKRMLYLGRIDPYTKGLDRLLIAISKIKERFKEARYVLEMYGSDEPVGGKKKLEGLIADLDLAEIVKIFPPVYGKEKELIICSSNFFVLTSRFEGHPMSAIECLSYGLPCLVSKETNIGDEVRLYNCGFVVDKNIENELLKCIQATEEEIRDYSSNAVKLCLDKFEWNAIGTDLFNYYKAVMRS